MKLRITYREEVALNSQMQSWFYIYIHNKFQKKNCSQSQQKKYIPSIIKSTFQPSGHCSIVREAARVCRHNRNCSKKFTTDSVILSWRPIIFLKQLSRTMSARPSAKCFPTSLPWGSQPSVYGKAKYILFQYINK